MFNKSKKTKMPEDTIEAAVRKHEQALQSRRASHDELDKTITDFNRTDQFRASQLKGE